MNNQANNIFVTAKELKEEFGVRGHFYQVHLKNHDPVRCRNVLEIVARKMPPQDAAAIYDEKLDAIFIMMNPGSSEPCSRVFNNTTKEQISQMVILLDEAKPDTTQYQLMRVMKRCNWSHVRVLNLSDLIQTKSAKFVKQYQQLEQITEFKEHSIFAENRRSELNKLLKPGVPIFCAWGVNTGLDDLIQRCMERLHDTEVYSKVSGLRKEKSNNKYRHPLPHGKENWMKWVNDMVYHIEISA